jgi:hypothetical protein
MKVEEQQHNDLTQPTIEESGEGYAWSTTSTDTKLITAHDVFKNHF